MRRTGFTLIELLMVISIIAVLAALLVPIIGIAKTYARNSKGQAQLGTIKASLEMFKNVNGTYPEKYVPPQPAPQVEVFSAVFKNGTTTRTVDEIGEDGWEKVADALLHQLQTVDAGTYREPRALRDPFTGGGVNSKVFRYRPAKYYPFLPGSTHAVDAEGQMPDGSLAPPNPDTYQLWSAGADGKDQFGERLNGRKSDDLTNWVTP